MTRTLYSAAMSLDGFITGPDGDMSWLTDYLGPDPEADVLVGAVGSLLVGRRTFGGDDPHKGMEGEGEPFGGGWEGQQFVLTHRPPAEPVAGVTFVTDLHQALQAARDAAGAKYVNVLGASVARQCLEIDALDEVLVYVMPVMLGDGVRLFEYPGGKKVRLERVKVSHAALATHLWFNVVR